MSLKGFLSRALLANLVEGLRKNICEKIFQRTLAMGKCLWFSVKIKVCQSALSSP